MHGLCGNNVRCNMHEGVNALFTSWMQDVRTKHQGSWSQKKNKTQKWYEALQSVKQYKINVSLIKLHHINYYRISIYSQNVFSSSWQVIHERCSFERNWDSGPCRHNCITKFSGDLKAACSWCKSFVLLHYKRVLLDMVTREAMEVHWTHFHVHGTSLK